MRRPLAGPPSNQHSVTAGASPAALAFALESRLLCLGIYALADGFEPTRPIHDGPCFIYRSLP
jgi:hypothetical protein